MIVVQKIFSTPRMFAHNLLSLFVIGYMAIFGTYAWLVSPMKTSFERIYGDNTYARQLLHWMQVYCLFGLLCKAIGWAPRMTKEIVAHHLCALVLCWIGSLPFAHYNALFFVGVIEWSTIPLTVLTFFRDLGVVSSKAIFILRCLFVTSFFIFRIILLLPQVILFLGDVFTVPWTFAPWVYYVSLLGTFALTSLQIYWAFGIIKLVMMKNAN